MDTIGADIVLQVLKEEGVDVIFGYPGASILPLNDRLRDNTVRHYLMRHEQAAAHAADGYARATGKVGVCRSEERRVGKECTSVCRSRWSPYH